MLPPIPRTLACEKRTLLVSRTPGTRWTVRMACGENDEKPSVFCTTSWPLRLSSTDLSIVSRAPAAKMDTNATSATPIMSAAAVTAVRPGLRSVFSRARRPVMPVRRWSGRPTAWPAAARAAG